MIKGITLLNQFHASYGHILTSQTSETLYSWGLQGFRANLSAGQLVVYLPLYVSGLEKWSI